MASRRLELAEAKVLIYKDACREAYYILTAGKDKQEYLVQRTVKVLTAATDAAAREESWVLLQSLPDGALFEVKIGRRYIKTRTRHLIGVICVPLETGGREELDSHALVRQLTIKED